MITFDYCLCRVKLIRRTQDVVPGLNQLGHVIVGKIQKRQRIPCYMLWFLNFRHVTELNI